MFFIKTWTDEAHSDPDKKILAGGVINYVKGTKWEDCREHEERLGGVMDLKEWQELEDMTGGEWWGGCMGGREIGHILIWCGDQLKGLGLKVFSFVLRALPQNLKDGLIKEINFKVGTEAIFLFPL